jgi:uncharacterized protein (DUF1501 family)
VRLENPPDPPDGRARRGARRFLGDLEARGLTDRVLVVATMSEFGRRPELYGSGGLDHGTASAALLAGAVSLGRIGKPLDLEQLDEDDNFVATTLMDQYYATLAETWFGVPAGDLLPGSPTPSSRKPHSQLAINVRRAQNQCAAPSALT